MYRYSIRDYHSLINTNLTCLDELDKCLLEIIRHDMDNETLKKCREQNCKIVFYSVKRWDNNIASGGKTLNRFDERIYTI